MTTKRRHTDNEPVDWSRVRLDPDRMSPRDRQGYEYLTDWLAQKLIEREGSTS